MVQTCYDIIKVQGGVSIAIGIKVETKVEEDLPAEQMETEFIKIPIS